MFASASAHVCVCVCMRAGVRVLHVQCNYENLHFLPTIHKHTLIGEITLLSVSNSLCMHRHTHTHMHTHLALSRSQTFIKSLSPTSSSGHSPFFQLSLPPSHVLPLIFAQNVDSVTHTRARTHSLSFPPSFSLSRLKD